MPHCPCADSAWIVRFTCFTEAPESPNRCSFIILIRQACRQVHVISKIFQSCFNHPVANTEGFASRLTSSQVDRRPRRLPRLKVRMTPRNGADRSWKNILDILHILVTYPYCKNSAACVIRAQVSRREQADNQPVSVYGTIASQNESRCLQVVSLDSTRC